MILAVNQPFFCFQKLTFLHFQKNQLYSRSAKNRVLTLSDTSSFSSTLAKSAFSSMYSFLFPVTIYFHICSLKLTSTKIRTQWHITQLFQLWYTSSWITFSLSLSELPAYDYFACTGFDRYDVGFKLFVSVKATHSCYTLAWFIAFYPLSSTTLYTLEHPNVR